MDSLQITLVIGLIIMGCINAGSLIWAFYLDHKLRQRPVPKVYHVRVEAGKIFSESDVAEVTQQARGQLYKAVQDASHSLNESLSSSVGQIAAHIDETTDAALNKEFEKYQANLQSLNDQAIQSFGKLQAELEQKRDELQQQLEQEVTAEREKRLEQFNVRLNDVISNYLAESLGTQVDLGAQSAYIFDTLTAHKDEIKREVSS